MDMVGHRKHAGFTVDMARNYNKLIATQARNRVTFSRPLDETLREELKQYVPYCVPIGVVDLLEIVEVDEQQSCQALRRVGRGR
jgi:hypothetical protein